MYGKVSSQRKAICQYDKDWNLIREFEYLSQVKDIGINSGNVTSAIKGRLKSAGGYFWKYKE